MKKTEIIFFGNGPLSEYALNILSKHFNIIFHAKTKEDLETVKELKRTHKNAYGVLASFGIIIKKDVLDSFEPEGILNIHPSLLPKYRGASPIESAILNGDTDFSVSIMKLVPAMDAGPIYYQTTIKNPELDKEYLYKILAETGAKWLVDNIETLPAPIPQDDKSATFTTKLEKSMGQLAPNQDSADKTLRKIIAFQNFPKPKYTFYNKTCIILKAHHPNPDETVLLPIICADKKKLSIDFLQPEGKKPMDVKSFLNGYAK